MFWFRPSGSWCVMKLILDCVVLQINCWYTVWWEGVGPPHFFSPTSWSARTWQWSTPSSMWKTTGGSSPTGASWNSWESWTCTSRRKEKSPQRGADGRTFCGASWASERSSWVSSHLILLCPSGQVQVTSKDIQCQEKVKRFWGDF